MLRKIGKPLISLLMFIGLIVGTLAAAIIGEAGPAGIPQQPNVQLEIDVVTRDRDLLHMTSNWPDNFDVQNVSNKDVNGFEITIMSAEDDDSKNGIGRSLGWGAPSQRNPAKNHHLKPLERVTVPVTPNIVQAFVKHGFPSLWIQLAKVWYDNNPDELMIYGSTVLRDKDNPNQFNVVINSKGIDPKTGIQVDPNVGYFHMHGSSDMHYNERKKPEKNHR